MSKKPTKVSGEKKEVSKKEGPQIKKERDDPKKTLKNDHFNEDVPEKKIPKEDTPKDEDSFQEEYIDDFERKEDDEGGLKLQLGTSEKNSFKDQKESNVFPKKETPSKDSIKNKKLSNDPPLQKKGSSIKDKASTNDYKSQKKVEKPKEDEDFNDFESEEILKEKPTSENNEFYDEDFEDITPQSLTKPKPQTDFQKHTNEVSRSEPKFQSKSLSKSPSMTHTPSPPTRKSSLLDLKSKFSKYLFQ